MCKDLTGTETYPVFGYIERLTRTTNAKPNRYRGPQKVRSFGDSHFLTIVWTKAFTGMASLVMFLQT